MIMDNKFIQNFTIFEREAPFWHKSRENKIKVLMCMFGRLRNEKGSAARQKFFKRNEQCLDKSNELSWRGISAFQQKANIRSPRIEYFRTQYSKILAKAFPKMY